jgi:RimJ/RimL family protein N-acetyltransferase
VVQWWGSKAAAEASMTMAAQSETALVRMIDIDGEPIGYAHVLDAADASLPVGTWQADVFIGSERHRGLGYGAQALGILRDELFATTLTDAVAVRVGLANERQVRAIERVGFQWRDVVQDPLLGRCWVLVAERRG